MDDNKSMVSYYMRLSPLIIDEDDTLLKAMRLMRKYSVNTLSIVKNDNSLIGYIDKDKVRHAIKAHIKTPSKIRNIKVRDIFKKYRYPVIIYPGMELINAYAVMKCLNLKFMPVVDTPWEKKVVGFLWLDDIKHEAEKYSLKVPV